MFFTGKDTQVNGVLGVGGGGHILPVDPEGDTVEPVGAAVESQPRPKESTDEHLEVKLDRVLEKMSKHGQDSLTSDEREILVKASELYKKRRK